MNEHSKFSEEVMPDRVIYGRKLEHNFFQFFMKCSHHHMYVNVFTQVDFEKSREENQTKTVVI